MMLQTVFLLLPAEIIGAIHDLRFVNLGSGGIRALIELLGVVRRGAVRPDLIMDDLGFRCRWQVNCMTSRMVLAVT